TKRRARLYCRRAALGKLTPCRGTACKGRFTGHLIAMWRLYQPCLPTRSMKAPAGDLWVYEIKHDGFRISARKIGGVVRLQTKQGYDYAERYPRIVDALMRLKAQSVVLDGEAICFTGVTEDF